MPSGGKNVGGPTPIFYIVRRPTAYPSPEGKRHRGSLELGAGQKGDSKNFGQAKMSVPPNFLGFRKIILDKVRILCFNLLQEGQRFSKEERQ